MRFKWNKTTLIIIFWILFMVVDSLKKIESLTANDETLWLYHLPGYLIWILLTFPLNFLFNWSDKLSLWKRFLFLAGSSLLLGSIKVMLSWILFYLGFWLLKNQPVKGFADFLSGITLFYFVEAFIISGVVLIVLFVIEVYNKYREQSLRNAALETQLAKAQLQTLKMQLRPHFLFNANNVISMLVRKGENEKAINMIAGLSDLLRMSLERENHQLITLEEELALLEKYLNIESMRFEDRLFIHYDIPESTRLAMVPNFILQPLVENAFKHGISKILGKAEIKIAAKKISERLRIRVFNSGPALESGKQLKHHYGIGLSNSINRLTQIYKSDGKFSLVNLNNGVQAEIEIPFYQK